MSVNYDFFILLQRTKVIHKLNRLITPNIKGFIYNGPVLGKYNPKNQRYEQRILVANDFEVEWFYQVTCPDTINYNDFWKEVEFKGILQHLLDMPLEFYEDLDRGEISLDFGLLYKVHNKVIFSLVANLFFSPL